MIKRTICAAIATLLAASIGSGHPGGLDSQGGHFSRKTGEYHYHRRVSAEPEKKPPVAAPARAVKPVAMPSAQARVTPALDPAKLASIEVYFSPDGGCTDAIIREIGRAKSRVLIQAYSFTSEPIARAIISAKKRGVEVVALLDKSNRTSQYSAATFLENQGVEVLIDAAHPIAHNKIILIDSGKDGEIITGSFNFSRAAEESNAENLLIIRGNPELFAKYEANFTFHREHCDPYTGPTAK